MLKLKRSPPPLFTSHPLRPLPSALCPLPFALCPLPSALCPPPSALRSPLRPQHSALLPPYPLPSTLYPLPLTLDHPPSTLYPPPSTLHPPPSTLHFLVLYHPSDLSHVVYVLPKSWALPPPVQAIPQPCILIHGHWSRQHATVDEPNQTADQTKPLSKRSRPSPPRLAADKLCLLAASRVDTLRGRESGPESGLEWTVSAQTGSNADFERCFQIQLSREML